LFTQLVTSTIERLAHVQLLEPDGLAGNRQVFPVVEMYRHILGATDKQSLGVPPYNLDMFLAHVVGFRNMNAHAASEKALGALAVRHDPRVMALLSATIAEAAADLMTRTLLPLSWTIGTISPSRTGHTVLKAPRSFVNHPLGEEITSDLSRIKSSDGSVLLVREKPQSGPTLVCHCAETFKPIENATARWGEILADVQRLFAAKIDSVFLPKPKDGSPEDEKASTIRTLLDLLQRKSLLWSDRIGEQTVTDAVKAEWKFALAGHSDEADVWFEVTNPVFTVATFIAELGLADKSSLQIGQGDSISDRTLSANPERYHIDFHVTKLLIFMANSVLEKGQKLGSFVKAQSADEGNEGSDQEAVWFALPKEKETDLLGLSGNNIAGKKNSLGHGGLELSGGAQDTFAKLGAEKLALSLALATGLVQRTTNQKPGSAKIPIQQSKLPDSIQLKTGELVSLEPKPVTIADLLNKLSSHEHHSAISHALQKAAGVVEIQGPDAGMSVTEMAFPVGRTRVLYVVSPKGPALHRNGSPFVSPKIVTFEGKKLAFETNFPDPNPFFVALAEAMAGKDAPAASSSATICGEALKDSSFMTDSGSGPRPGQIAMKVDGNWVAGDNVGDFLEALVRYAYRHGWLAEGTLPFKVGSRRYLVAADFHHVDGLEFTSRREVALEDGLVLYVETNWGRPYALVLAEKLCGAKSAAATDATSSYAYGSAAVGTEAVEENAAPILALNTDNEDTKKSPDSSVSSL
jgi:hypothetical protein